MKGLLTVTGSGCVALGHPASALSEVLSAALVPREYDGYPGGRRFQIPSAPKCADEGR